MSKSAAGLILLLTVATGSFAQSGRVRERPVSPPASDDDSVRLRVEEVLLPVSVRSTLGKLPTTLLRTDFILAEDDKPQRINDVLRVPANILLILDGGGESTLKNTNVNRDLALKIVELLGPQDRVAVVAYGDRVELVSAWTSDKVALKQALGWKFRPGIKSPLYDSLVYAAEELLPKVSGRRSVILLTDGVDAAGKVASFEPVLEAMNRARATVYVVTQANILLKDIKPRAFNPLSWYEMLDPAARARIQKLRNYYRRIEAGQVTFRGLAEETGGTVWDATTLDAMRGLASNVINEISTEFVIAYTSQRPRDDTSFHSVKVYGLRPELQIRTRKGIYPGAAPQKPEARGPGAVIDPAPAPPAQKGSILEQDFFL